MPKKTTNEPKLPTRKTEALSIRIEPRMRYGLEILARLQRRAVTGVVEWSIAQAFQNETTRDSKGSEVGFERALDRLWSPNEPERILALRFYYPALMTFEEERLAKVLTSTAVLWSAREPSYGSFRWDVVLPVWEQLKPVLVAAAERPVITALSEPELNKGGLTTVPGDEPF